jgi:hypothetical protein
MPKKSLKRQRKQRGGENEEQKLKTLYTTTQKYLEHDNFLFEFVNYVLNSSDNTSIIKRYGVYKRLLDCVSETKDSQTQSATFSHTNQYDVINSNEIPVAIPAEADSSYKYSKMFEEDLNRVFSNIPELGKKVSTKYNQNGHPELFDNIKALFIKDSTDDILTYNAKQALNFASIDNYTEHSGYIDKTKHPFLGLEDSYNKAMNERFPDDFINPSQKSSCFPWCRWGGTRNKRNKRHKKTLRNK